MSVEAILKARLDAYTDPAQISKALEDADLDPTIAIRVVALKEEEVDGVPIRDSGAIVSAKTRVSAHLHSGEEGDNKELTGLEVYKILAGTGNMSLGTPRRNLDGSFLLGEGGKVVADYDPPIPVKPGDYVTVKPGQVHSLEAGEQNLVFTFTSSPNHMSPADRVMAVNPS